VSLVVVFLLFVLGLMFGSLLLIVVVLRFVLGLVVLGLVSLLLIVIVVVLGLVLLVLGLVVLGLVPLLLIVIIVVLGLVLLVLGLSIGVVLLVSSVVEVIIKGVVAIIDGVGAQTIERSCQVIDTDVAAASSTGSNSARIDDIGLVVGHDVDIILVEDVSVLGGNSVDGAILDDRKSGDADAGIGGAGGSSIGGSSEGLEGPVGSDSEDEGGVSVYIVMNGAGTGGAIGFQQLHEGFSLGHLIADIISLQIVDIRGSSSGGNGQASSCGNTVHRDEGGDGTEGIAAAEIFDLDGIGLRD